MARNTAVLESSHSSSDVDLDISAIEKPLAERDRGVLVGPFEVGEDLANGPVCYVPRRGIWELHGGATEPSCRVIDDLLFGEQNSTVERFSSHRPTDVDGLAAQVRAVAAGFPQRALSGWPIDFAKAYKLVPGDHAQLRFVVVAQWCPYRCRPVLWVARSQVFGGPSSPLNFARYPAWMCEALAVYFSLATSHCVDDMIGIDPSDIVVSGWSDWRYVARRCGWEVSDEKSPPPISAVHGSRCDP